MATILLTEQMRSGEYLVSEVSTQSREVGVITGGAFPAGAVLGRITASKKLTQVNPSASDGSQTAVAVLYAYTDASAGDVQQAVTVRLTEVNGQVVQFPPGITTNQQNTIVTQLAAVGILVHDPPASVVVLVPSAPVSQSAPVISGSTIVGQTLTVAPGSWAAVPAPSYGYVWQRNGSTISGATGSSYTLVSGDTGATITVYVTATNTAGNASATSAGVGPVTSSAAATITGSAPSGTVGSAYSYTFATTGFSGAITATVGSGALPAGLALSVSGSNVVLSGTPTTAATSNFTVHAVGATSSTADSGGQSVTIAAAGSAPGSTKPRFAYGPTNASGTASVFNSFFGSATEFSGSSNGGKAGTLTSAANSATYTWLFIPASADASGIVVTDPSSFHGGFSGATYAGINGDGDPADPIIVRQNYTDATGFAWHAYRSNGKSAAASYTVS